MGTKVKPNFALCDPYKYWGGMGEMADIVAQSPARSVHVLRCSVSKPWRCKGDWGRTSGPNYAPFYIITLHLCYLEWLNYYRPTRCTELETENSSGKQKF